MCRAGTDASTPCPWSGTVLSTALHPSNSCSCSACQDKAPPSYVFMDKLLLSRSNLREHHFARKQRQALPSPGGLLKQGQALQHPVAQQHGARALGPTTVPPPSPSARAQTHVQGHRPLLALLPCSILPGSHQLLQNYWRAGLSTEAGACTLLSGGPGATQSRQPGHSSPSKLQRACICHCCSLCLQSTELWPVAISRHTPAARLPT